RVAGLLRIRESPGVRTARAAVLKTAQDAGRPLPERLAALAPLAGAPHAELGPLHELLDPRQPIDLQVAAVPGLASAEGPDVVPALLKGWDGYSPRLQTAVLDAIFGRQDRLPLLLDAIANKTVDPSILSPFRQTQLLENPDPRIRARARSLLAGRATSEDRKQVLQRYQASLTLKRDVRRGKEVFEKQCMKCHQLNGRGFAVGPDLAAVQNRPDESLLVDVLDPSSTITVGYRTYTAVARNGKLYTGTLAAETATGATLRREQGEQDTILRKDIEQMAASSKSLMPEGIEKEISPQDLADLIGYLRQELKVARSVVLFDDDASFVAALNEGKGGAALTTEDRYSGEACLRVTPPGRGSPRLAGWTDRIVETPGPGEYRYLRFAWKTPAGSGVMLELADNGAWPDPEDLRGRLHGGRNTSGWRSVRVGQQVPRDWVVVTVDLWKQFGTMTLTGIGATALGDVGYFDRIELLQSPEEPSAPKKN